MVQMGLSSSQNNMKLGHDTELPPQKPQFWKLTPKKLNTQTSQTLHGYLQVMKTHRKLSWHRAKGAAVLCREAFARAEEFEFVGV